LLWFVSGLIDCGGYINQPEHHLPGINHPGCW